MFALSDFIEAKDAVCFKYIGQMTGRTVKNFDAVGEAFVAAPKVNVYAMGVGPKMVDGRPTEELAVRYYVARKLPRAELSSKDILPARISGIATDIVEADFPEFAVNLRHRHRPMLPGVSVAHIKGGPGTMGCYCRSTRKDDAQEQLYMLSCNHVLAMFNSAKPGDLITQPATSLDGGDARRDGVAGLERFVAFEFGRTGNAPNANRVDAAIARLHAAEQATANWHVHDGAGALDGVAFLDGAVIAENHAADIVAFQVQGHALDATGKLDHFAGLDIVEAIDAGDAVADAEHLSDFGDLRVCAEVLDFALEDRGNFSGLDIHFTYSLFTGPSWPRGCRSIWCEWSCRSCGSPT